MVSVNNKKTEVTKLFGEVHKTLKDTMTRSYENIGITIPQSLVIGTLLKYGEMKITELSKKINLSNSTISGIVDRLEKQGLVLRTRSLEDRRIVFVNVTPKFSEMYKGIYKKTEESFEELLSPASSEDLDKVIEGLHALKRILEMYPKGE